MTGSAPSTDDEPAGVTSHPLPDYEPGPDERWPSMRPATRRRPPAQQQDGWPPIPPAALARVVRHVLEVLEGRRPATQLRHVLPTAAYEALLARLREIPPGGRHVLRRIHTSYPTPTALEACAVIDINKKDEQRVMTAAVRLNREGEAWTCAAFQLLG